MSNSRVPIPCTQRTIIVSIRKGTHFDKTLPGPPMQNQLPKVLWGCFMQTKTLWIQLVNCIKDFPTIETAAKGGNRPGRRPPIRPRTTGEAFCELFGKTGTDPCRGPSAMPIWDGWWQGQWTFSGKGGGWVIDRWAGSSGSNKKDMNMFLRFRCLHLSS